jgi:nitroreductase
MNPCLEEMEWTSTRSSTKGAVIFTEHRRQSSYVSTMPFQRQGWSISAIGLGYLVLIAYDLGYCTCPVGLINAYEDDIRDV